MPKNIKNNSLTKKKVHIQPNSNSILPEKKINHYILYILETLLLEDWMVIALCTWVVTKFHTSIMCIHWCRCASNLSRIKIATFFSDWQHHLHDVECPSEQFVVECSITFTYVAILLKQCYYNSCRDKLIFSQGTSLHCPYRVTLFISTRFIFFNLSLFI